jgi:hypothetical protein
MVIFDLLCVNGHPFEGWFSDLTDLEEQLASGLLVCPVCGEGGVTRRPSTFGLVRHRPPAVPGQSTQPGDNNELAFKVFKNLVELSDKLEKDFVDVGTNFMVEALKMHYGVTPARNIRGQSTTDEEQVLKNEGIDFFKLPMLNRKNTSS